MDLSLVRQWAGSVGGVSGVESLMVMKCLWFGGADCSVCILSLHSRPGGGFLGKGLSVQSKCNFWKAQFHVYQIETCVLFPESRVFLGI